MAAERDSRRTQNNIFGFFFYLVINVSRLKYELTEKKRRGDRSATTLTLFLGKIFFKT